MKNYKENIEPLLIAILAWPSAVTRKFKPTHEIKNERDANIIKSTMKELNIDGDAGHGGRPGGWISIYFEGEHYGFCFSHDYGWYWEHEDPRAPYYKNG